MDLEQKSSDNAQFIIMNVVCDGNNATMGFNFL